MTVQKLKPTIDSEFTAARMYYEIISSLNQLELKGMELNLLAFMAVKGSISNTNNKEVFCETFKSTKASINNTISELTKKSLLKKTEGKVRIISSIALNFKDSVVLKITLDAETRK